MFDTRIIAERKIQEAIDEGVFDNLPGKGQPLNLEEDAHIPAHLRIAARVLKNADVAPEWIQIDQGIRRAKEECARTWSQLEQEYPRRKSRAEAAREERAMRHFAEWHARTRARFLKAIKQVNSDILTFNIVAPPTASTHIPFKLPEETARFDAAFPAPEGIVVELPESREEKESKMRASAMELYRARTGR